MEPALDGVLWSLPVGETSAPFAGRFGYEIVKVESRRILPVSEARQDIIGEIKFLKTTRERQRIISQTPISLKRTYMDSQLPCELNAVALGK
jgi:parvulin-like peptidyl-prolyl isomerase